LELIASGLTSSGLCGLIRNNPQGAVNAIAQGATEAYNNGQPATFAQALTAGVGAAASNGCTKDWFEIINQAIV
jgi:acylphosphatase